MKPESKTLLNRFITAHHNELIYGEQETASLKRCREYNEKTRGAREALEAYIGGLESPDLSLEPVEGDLLPAVGTKVLIHLARQDAWVEHTVIGYYVWKPLRHQVQEGEKNAHRVFVRVKDSNGYENARLLSEVRLSPPSLPSKGQ